MTETILHPRREYNAIIKVDRTLFHVPIRVKEITKLRVGDTITYRGTRYTMIQNSEYSEYVVFTYVKNTLTTNVYLNINDYDVC